MGTETRSVGMYASTPISSSISRRLYFFRSVREGISDSSRLLRNHRQQHLGNRYINRGLNVKLLPFRVSPPAVNVEQHVCERVANLFEHAEHGADGDERVYHSEELWWNDSIQN